MKKNVIKLLHSLLIKKFSAIVSFEFCLLFCEIYGIGILFLSKQMLIFFVWNWTNNAFHVIYIPHYCVTCTLLSGDSEYGSSFCLGCVLLRTR